MGFARAMRLHSGAWARIEASDELGVIEAVKVLQTLYAAANGTPRLAEEAIELLERMAPTSVAPAPRYPPPAHRRQG